MSNFWAQVTAQYFPEIKKTGVMWDDGEGNIEEVETVNLNRTIFFNIQKSKTGKRVAVGRLPSYRSLKDIAERNYNLKLNDLLDLKRNELVFTYKEFISDKKANTGIASKLLKPKSFAKLFDTYLKDHNLRIDPVTNQKRVLYSLRHTYATLALTYDQIAIHTLAKQMGTSVVMIEKHYSHLDAVKAAHQLRGSESRQLIEASRDIDERYIYKGKI